jgi:uncharacterized protein YndB with AHSA1/START domain
MENQIEKQIQLAAPVSRVWQAVSDSRQFGEWFKVKMDGPFVAGQAATGVMTYPGYEHLRIKIKIHKIEPMNVFSFYWHPYAVDPTVDYESEEPTLVQFRLEPAASGTLLTVTESGFEKVPAHRRAEAFLRNGNGWTQQMKNITAYVSQAA